MSTLTERLGRHAMVAIVAAFGLAGMSGICSAQSGSVTASPPRVNDNALRMQVERSRIQTQTYQLQQKIYREQDRRNSMQRPSQPNVPVFRSTCTPTNGVPCR